jgi:hypothetical protein
MTLPDWVPPSSHPFNVGRVRPQVRHRRLSCCPSHVGRDDGRLHDLREGLT